uniref:Rx N-terminal domain-containing protein n=1 Tax=Oryza glumipatula TaxID=40148 RepID=A0A0E0B7L9_9ORYZ
MELIKSAITGDLTSRLISFLVNKFSDHTCCEEKVTRLEQLLLRVHMVVEEADGRYITNSCMLVHLKMVVTAMYSGYRVLDIIKYMKNKEDTGDLVNDSAALSFATPLKRSRTTVCTARKRIFSSELQCALEKLESVVGDMNEFVILLAGCERISQKPYDTYIYIDNFMFGRHVEKQHLINFLLENNIAGPPPVLPIIGGRGVGKRTLVTHVCNDERVSSQFNFILHINGANVGQITENGNLSARTLVIVEFFSDVDDNDWKTFYSHVTNLSRENKVIILTKIEKLERFGTVKPMTLNRLVYEEYRYLFKTLTFGSTNPVDHPQLIPIVEEFAELLEGRLIPANILADVLRKNLNVHFWLCKLRQVQITAKKNMTMSGTHPHKLFDQGHPAHFTGYILSPPTIITPNVPQNDLPQLRFGDLLTGHIFPPKVFLKINLNHLCQGGSIGGHFPSLVKRLEQLLQRVHMVVQEADGRYITNHCMLTHLKTIVAAMYSGYHALDTIKYMKNNEGANDLVNDSSALYFATPLKRSRTTTVCPETKKKLSMQLLGALQNIETVIGDINEFVILLAGCERMSYKPYDAYLYIDNFMFGRHVEKQHLINFLLENNIPGPPAVIPVIGGHKVGKRTLVTHVCNDERIRSHFSLIFHISGANLSRITENGNISARTLVIVEFISDVDDNDWITFYSSVANLNRGNKVIILTKIQKLERFGTVKPIAVDRLVYEEYRYLFKTLAFGSANPMDHPQLVPIVEEFAMLLRGRLIQANILADVLRKNLNIHFWLFALKGVQITVKKYLSMNGTHPHELFDQGHPVHLTDYVLYPADTTENAPNNDLPKLTFGDLITGRIFPPKGNFNLVSWESRIPPYTSFVHMARFSPSLAEDKPESHLSGRKRPRSWEALASAGIIVIIPALATTRRIKPPLLALVLASWAASS